jgi:hypothetical protein
MEVGGRKVEGGKWKWEVGMRKSESIRGERLKEKGKRMMLGTGCWMLGTGCWILDAGY